MKYLQTKWVAVSTISALLAYSLFGCASSSTGNPTDAAEAPAQPAISEVEPESDDPEGDSVSEGAPDEADYAGQSADATEQLPPEEPSEESTQGNDSELDSVQMRTIAMLNYLMVKTEEINSSRNSRLALEEIYTSLINDTNKSAVDELALTEITDLLDTLNGYRMIAVKRERLEYIYEQNQAQAFQAAIPSPLTILNVVQSKSLVQLATSVTFLVVDSVSSYQGAMSDASFQYLTDGWELDDAESETLHACRRDTFEFATRTVRQYVLPNSLVLTEADVDKLVSWSANENVVRRIEFLESEQSKYQFYGGYWLILARSYFENDDYEKCIEAFQEYDRIQADIFNCDYDRMQSIPFVLASATQCMSNEEYIRFAEPLLKYLHEESQYRDWELLYFAAQGYVDLAARAEDESARRSYLESAYEVSIDLVNILVGEQQQLNAAYLAPIREVPVPNGSTKEQKEEIKKYNKMLREERKTELPPVYQPLELSCDLLFALADELDVSEAEQRRIEGILHANGEPLFLTRSVDEKYWFSGAPYEDFEASSIQFDGTKLVVPAALASESSSITVTVGSGRELLPGEWWVKQVDRKTEGDLSSFEVTYVSKGAKRSYSDGDVVTITIANGEGENAAVTTLVFSVSVEKRPIIPDKVEFELVELR